jgi:hypothetical protein
MKLMTARSFFLALSILSLGQSTWGRTFGPLPYQALADSPFNHSQLGTSFFVEDFHNGVDYVTHHLEFLDLDYQTVKFKTPGAYSGAYYNIHGSRGGLMGGFVCTNSIPPSCSSAVDVSFQKDELGFLPQAVGIALDNASLASVFSVDLVAIDAENQVIETVSAPSFPVFGIPGAIVAQGYTFLGITHPEGISRIVLGSSSIFILREVQYGLLVPEPSTFSLGLATSLILYATHNIFRCRRRQTHFFPR